MIRCRPAVLVFLVVTGCCACGATATKMPTSTTGSRGGSVHVTAGATCSNAAAPARRLGQIKSTQRPLPGNPFGVVATGDGTSSFVSLNRSVVVLSNASVPPKVVGQVSLPGSPAGEVLTHDGRHLLVATGNGAEVIDVDRAVHGTAGSVVATLASPGSGAIEVAVSKDDRYAFVTLESSNEMAVFDLRTALAGRSGSSFVGTVPLGQAPVGMAVAPDGRWLYVTSESRSRGSATVDGTVSVIDVERAETAPGHAVVSTVAAGCSPVRVVTSADGGTVWVSARGSDKVLAFDAARLRDDPLHALVASVAVGPAPVGLALVDDGRRLVVSDSARFTAGQPRSDLAVVDVQKALAGRDALVGYIAAGRFPREMVDIAGRHTLLVTNFTSEQLQAVDLTGLP